MKIFQFVAFYLPKKHDSKKECDKPRIIAGPETILAKDEREATMKAARSIPEDFVDKLDEVELAVRPF